MNPVDRVLMKLKNASPTADGWSACCPAHSDHRPSLSVAEGKDGRALVKCHRGCSVEAICSSVGLTLADLMPPAQNRIVATYDYLDEAGMLLFQVVRYEPKDFRQRRPKPGGGWEWSVKGVRVVPYRLPELLAKPTWPVAVVEGEKDADNLARIGVLATCNAGGAGKWRPEHAEFLRGRCVVVIPDNDDAGRNHALLVAASLQGIAASVRVVDLPGLRPKGDVSDWIDAGGTKDDLKQLTLASPDWTPPPALELGPILTRIADVEATEVKWLWPGRIPLGRITLVVGRPGEGKSFFTLDVAARVSTGMPWPDGSECPAGSVILISAEDDPADTIRPRLEAQSADVDRIHLLSAVRYIEGKETYERLVTLGDLDAIEECLNRVADCKLIVVDPIGSVMGTGDAYRDNEVRALLAPLARLAERYGPALLVVAHRRKSVGRNANGKADDQALGSRAFTAIARAVWHLTRDPEDKDRRLLLPGKNNLAHEGTGLAFSITGQPAHIVWESDPIEMNADEALAAENDERAKSKRGPAPEMLNRAADWLRDRLQAGPVQTATIKEEGKAAGHKWRTLQRARTEIGATSRRQSPTEPRQWELPGEAACQDTET